MTAVIIPPERLTAKRRERERLRQEGRVYVGSILAEVTEAEKPSVESFERTATWLRQLLRP